MSDPYFQSQFAERIGGANYGKGTEIYKFEKIKRAKRKALADFPERSLVDFGIGENDSMADESIRKRDGGGDQQAREPRLCGQRHRRCSRRPPPGSCSGISASTLDPATQVNHCIGSKPALAMLPVCFINPGDVTLMTVPGYPVAGTYTRYCGGSVFKLPLLAENDFLPDLKSVPADVLRKTKLLVLNYPNSPTGKVATREFYEQVIEFAQEHKIVVVQDAAHMMLTLRQASRSAFWRCRGRWTSAWKSTRSVQGCDMIGWRIGFVCGHAKHRAGLRRRERQQRFRPVHGAFRNRPRQPSTTTRSRTHVRTKYRPPPGEARGHAQAVRLRCQNAGRNATSFTPALRRDRPSGTEVRNRRSRQPVPHHASNRSSPCRGTTPAPFLRFSVTYEAAARSGRRRAHGGSREAVEGERFGILG